MYFCVENERRLIIIGKVGAGKSTLGNAILLRNVFTSGQSFRSVTKEWEHDSCIRRGIKYRVWDTPGVYGIDEQRTEAFKQIARLTLATFPGFHCIVLVISATQRITEEDLRVFNDFEAMLGKKAFQNFMLIVFSGVLKENVQDLIRTNANIEDLCKRCGHKMGFVKDTNRHLGDDDEFFVHVNTIFEENCKEGYCHIMYDSASELIISDAKKIHKRKQIPFEQAYQEAKTMALNGKADFDKKLISLAKKKGTLLCSKCTIL